MPLSLSRLHLACLFVCTAWLAGCGNQPNTENTPPLQISDASKHALDWAGTYQAVLPCHDCPGIAISVQLRSDNTALVRERRMGGSLDEVVAPIYTGPFRFEPPGGNLITLRATANETPAYQFLVAEDWIEMRERTTGTTLSPTAVYRLRKTSLPIQ